MPAFLIVVVFLIYLSSLNKNIARYLVGSVLKSVLAVVVIMATIILGVMLLSSLQVP
jgi:hypothetical protein